MSTAVSSPAAATHHATQSATNRVKLDNLSDYQNFIPNNASKVAPYLGLSAKDPEKEKIGVAFHLMLMTETLRACQKENFAPRLKNSAGDKEIHVDAKALPNAEALAEGVGVSAERAKSYFDAQHVFRGTPVVINGQSGNRKLLATNYAGTKTGDTQDEKQKIAIATNHVGPNFKTIPALNQEAKGLIEESRFDLKMGPTIGASGNATAANAIEMDRRLHFHELSAPTLGLAPSNLNAETMEMIASHKIPANTEGKIGMLPLSMAKTARNVGVLMANAGIRQLEKPSPELQQTFGQPHMVSVELYKGKAADGKREPGLSDIMGELQEDMSYAGSTKLAQTALGAPHLGNLMVQAELIDELGACKTARPDVDIPTGKKIYEDTTIHLQSDTERQQNGTADRADNLGIHQLRPENLYAYVNFLTQLIQKHVSLAEQHPDYKEFAQEKPLGSSTVDTSK